MQSILLLANVKKFSLSSISTAELEQLLQSLWIIFATFTALRLQITKQFEMHLKIYKNNKKQIYIFSFRVCSDGRLDGVHSSLTLPTVRGCVIPLKCKTTQWSDWTMEANCSRRMRRWTRTRTIVRPPQGEGRPCPHLLEYKQGHDLEANGTSITSNHEKCKEP